MLYCKSESGWENDAVTSDWYELSGALQVAGTPVAPSKVPSLIRKYPLMCYDQFDLYEIRFDSEHYELCAFALWARSSPIAYRPAILLDWTKHPICKLNKDTKCLQLDTDEKRAEYVRLYCSFLGADEGPFAILESNNEVPWIADGISRPNLTVNNITHVERKAPISVLKASLL